MFDHYSRLESTRSPLSPLVLSLATALMILLGGGTIWFVAYLMSLLGFYAKPPPVEVTYDPYKDGTTLEQMLGGGAPPPIEGSEPPPR